MKLRSAVKSVSHLIPVVAAFGIVLSSGCIHLKGNDDYSDFIVSTETLRQIEPIELSEAGEEKKALIPDRDEPEPAELEISLEECRALTLENNLDLKVQLIGPAISAERVKEAEAEGFEAAFSARAIYSKTHSPVSSDIELQGNQAENGYTNLGVNVPLRTGGEIEIDFVDNRVKSNSEYAILNPSYSSDFSASISQPLLRNAGIRANTHAIRIQEYNRQKDEASTKLQAMYKIRDVDRAYWNLYAARKLLDVRKQQEQYTKAMFEQTERLMETGIRARIDLIRIQAELAEKAVGIIEAENSVRDRERELKQLINKAGLGIETETVLIPSTEPTPIRYEIENERMVIKALNNRMDMLDLELQIAWDDSTIDKRRNEKLPSVDITYTYNMNGLGETRSGSYDMLYDHKYKDHRVDLEISMPLGNKAGKSRLRQAIYQQNQTLLQRENKKAQIEYEVLTGIDQLDSNWLNIMATRQATIHRDQQYQAEKRRFEIGLGKSTDVLEAQKDLAEAQRQEIEALTRYQKSLVDLAVATGTLLGAANVLWEPLVPEEPF